MIPQWQRWPLSVWDMHWYVYARLQSFISKIIMFNKTAYISSISSPFWWCWSVYMQYFLCKLCEDDGLYQGFSEKSKSYWTKFWCPCSQRIKIYIHIHTSLLIQLKISTCKPIYSNSSITKKLSTRSCRVATSYVNLFMKPIICDLLFTYQQL